MSSTLESITYPIKLQELPSGILRLVQIELVRLGYLPSEKDVDGILGVRTTEAFHQFKINNYLGDLDTLGATTVAKLLGAQPKHIITEYQVETIFGRNVTAQQLADLNNCLRRFHILTPSRIRHFLAQVAHESGGGQWLCEIASGAAYEGRRDLGNTQLGWGRLYKGGGYIQLTGRYNYKKLAEYLKDERVLEEGCAYIAAHLPATASGFWWSILNDMNNFVDRGATCRQVSARVNGRDPANGLADRERYYKIACRVVT